MCVDNEIDGDLETYRAHRIDIYEEFRTGVSSDLSTNFKGPLDSSTVQYKLLNDPVTIQSIKPDPNQAFPKVSSNYVTCFKSLYFDYVLIKISFEVALHTC